MADVSKINLPNGTSLNIKDETARESLVPAVTSSDNGKVLKATYSGGEGSYSWETGGGGGGTPTLESIGIAYGENTQSSNTRLVSITGFVLQTGSIVSVRFTQGLSLVTAKTLNVNNTGAITIRFKSSTTYSTTWASGSVITFQYDGTYWNIISSISGALGGSRSVKTFTEVTQGDVYNWNNKSNLTLTTSTIPPADTKSGNVGSSSYAACADHSHPSLSYGYARSVTIGTDWTDSGISIEVPQGEMVQITATINFNTDEPRGIKIQGVNSSHPMASTEISTVIYGLSTSCVIYNYGTSGSWTYNIWAKSKSSGSEIISVAVTKIPV